ncbi:MAG: hypothetical protein AUJ71_03950 [Candidatus Omnitrophica bacterium CG1_02_49_16]|nr:MAG: hypothetical protein AUJ71_03950 [Candidatus Omnitrophica bacterium CG1_02_49_16]
MSFRTKVELVLVSAIVVLGLLCGMYYRKWRDATNTNVQVAGELQRARTTITQLERDVANIPHEKIKTVIRIVPTTITETHTITETITIGNTVYITNTITVRETIKNTEIILVQDVWGHWYSNEQQINVIINQTELGFVFSPALSVLYAPTASFLPAISVRFLRIFPVYIGVTISQKTLGLDASYEFYKNVSGGIGWGCVVDSNNKLGNGIYGLISVSF